MSDAFTLQGSIEIDMGRVLSDIKKLSNEVDGTGRKFSTLSEKLSSIGSKFGQFGSKMTKSVTLPIVGLGAATFKMASDMEESLNKVEVACGSGADEVKKFGETTLKSFGIAKGTAYDMVSTFSDMGGGMGLTTDKANEMSMSLVGLAGDLSSFKNISVERSQTALTGIYTGETEALKSLGIVMTQQNLIEYAASQGIKKKVKDMNQAELVQLRYNFVMEQTKNAQGDFARTSDGAANSSRTFMESLKELGATIGEKLLPIITPIIQTITEWVNKFANLSDETQNLILIGAGLIAAIGPLATIISGIITVVNGLSLAFTFLAANPIVLIIGAIIGLIGGIIYLWNTSEEFRQGVLWIWDTIQLGFEKFSNFLNNIFSVDWSQSFGSFGDVMNGFMATASGIWESIKRIFGGVVDFITGVFTGDWEKAWDGVVNIFGGIMDGLGAVIKMPLNAVIGLINGAISGLNSINVEIPDWVPFFGGKNFGLDIPKIKYLENGGILTKPTMLNPYVMAGEKNKGKESQAEAVIPLDSMYKNIREIVRQEVDITLNIDGRTLTRYAVAPHQKELNDYNNIRRF